MTEENPLEALFKQVEQHGWAYSYLTPLLLNDSKEKQKKILRFELPTQIYFALDDKDRLQDIKNIIKLYPDLKPDMITIMSSLKDEKIFTNLREDKLKKLKRIVNELNKAISKTE